VITGFNTDVEHEGVVYHVQTEDKGLETPLILSLVYTGGAILASKRARYDDLIAAGFDEKLLADRLQRQHKLICAAIRAGRIEDLKKMSGRENPSRAAKKNEAKKVEAEEEPLQVIEEPLEVLEEPLEVLPPVEVSPQIELTGPYEPIPPPPVPAQTPTPAEAASPPPRKKGHSTRKLVPPVGKPAPPIEKTASPAEKHLPPPRRIAPRATRTPAQKRVTDFVPHGAAINELHLGLIDEKNYRGGDRINLRVHVAGGLERRMPVSDAEVIVKILGSTFRPLILQSKTGPDGIATFIIQLPHFRSGRAAILVRATSDSHEAELRRIIQQG
jgi:hypothetical protein